MSEEDVFGDSVTLSQIASKMPTPPPRPASIASSTRSSKRSSLASRQSKSYSSMLDVESKELPPTPSLNGRYTGMSLGDELAQGGSEYAFQPPTAPSIEASSPTTNWQRPRSRSSSMNANVKRRSSKPHVKDREKEGPTIVIAVQPPDLQSAPTIPPRRVSRTPSSPSEIEPVRPPAMGLHPKEEGVPKTGHHTAILAFFSDIFKACCLLFSLVGPIMKLTLESFRSLFASNDSGNNSRNKAGQMNRSIAEDTAQLSRSFAERFKFIICTSCLLGNSLAISQYDQATPQSDPPKIERDVSKTDESKPTSQLSSQVDTSASPLGRQAQALLQLSSEGQFLLNSTLLALLVMVPISKDWQTWFRSSILLVSLSWGAVAVRGIEHNQFLAFDVSHHPTGPYSLLSFGRRADEVGKTDRVSNPTTQAVNISRKSCEEVSCLIKACKSFDVECNKTIAAIQEVELVSRGFKLTHPLPPISRIEASRGGGPSPLSMRNGALTSPVSAMGQAARLSRSSSSGASAASSGWKHHGSHPSLSLGPYSGAISGRVSPQKLDVEPMRLLSLRKTLMASFEAAAKILDQTTEKLKSLVDETELHTLQDMYDVDAENLHDVSFRSGMEPWTAPADMTGAEKRASWTALTRARLEDEASSPVKEDFGTDRPCTPQRLSLLLDTARSKRESINLDTIRSKRDSVTSESWSMASPSRDVFPPRGGSRLGYVSDKTPAGSSSTPNRSAASKRQSYISSSSSTASPTQSRAFLMQMSSPSLGSQGNRKRASLLSSGLLDETRETTPTQNIKNDMYLIVSLKSSFEALHQQRRKLLCHLLALDFSLSEKVNIAGKFDSASTMYWNTVAKVMRELTATFSSIASHCAKDVAKEMSLDGIDKTAKESSNQDSSLLSPTPNASQDYTGLEDRLNAMGLALRSIQIKMRACAIEMKVKAPPALHGMSTAEEDRSSSSKLTGLNATEAGSTQQQQHETSERILETIREDLLMLSAEWENALKISRAQQRALTPPSVIGDTTVSTLNSTRLDSPQEAEEDAMRQWIQAKRGDDASDSEDERTASRMLENGMLQWAMADKEKDNAATVELADLLIKSASPDHLPPPGGLEKVYESESGMIKAALPRSTLSREQRIRLVKEQRDAGPPLSASKQASTVGIIQELQSVMKNRKEGVAGNGNGIGHDTINNGLGIGAALPFQSTDQQQQQQQSQPIGGGSPDSSLASAFAF